MQKCSKLLWALAILLFAGGSYHHIHELSIPANHPPLEILSQQSRIRKALNYIGKKDNGIAIVRYNRTDHILKFSILYMNDIKYFTGHNGLKQKRKFEHISGVHNVVLQRDTLTAVKRRDIELREEYDQKLENKAEAYQAKGKAAQKKFAQEEADKKATIASLSKSKNTSMQQQQHHLNRHRPNVKNRKGRHKP